MNLLSRVGIVFTSLVLSAGLANAASDLIGDAASISLPYQEIVDNSGFTTLPDPFCGNSNFSGDFFYRYTPSGNETINIKAIGDDTEIKVFDLADAGNECVVYQDDDNIVSPNWWTNTYPGLVAGSSCDGDCAEDLDIALTGGTEYVIAIASNDTDALGFICLNIAVGAGAAADTCAPATPVPALPLWAFLALAGVTGLYGARRLRKAA
ncbi:hypothetical protein [Haliea sp.]